jgi:hypothetical protein
MVVSSDSSILDYQPVTSLLLGIVVSAFTFLTALSIRDSVTQSIVSLTPGDIHKQVVFTIFSAAIFLFITVLLAYLFQESIPH